jgi:hypothetical protein
MPNAIANSPETQTCAVMLLGHCVWKDQAVTYALEGYPSGDPRRWPNNDDVEVSQHVYGLAVDVSINELTVADPWDPQIDAIAARYGLYRPYGKDSEYPEPWHFELAP